MKLGPHGTVLVLALMAFLLCLAGCKKEVRGVMIFEDGQVRPAMLVLDEKGMAQPWDPGVVMLFRTDGKAPEGEAGKAGVAYRIDDSHKLVKIRELDLNKSDSQLAKEFQ